LSFTKTTGANKQALVSLEARCPCQPAPIHKPASFAGFPVLSHPTKSPPGLRHRLNEANEANPCPDTLERPPHYTPTSRGIGRSNHAWGSSAHRPCTHPAAPQHDVRPAAAPHGLPPQQQPRVDAVGHARRRGCQQEGCWRGRSHGRAWQYHRVVLANSFPDCSLTVYLYILAASSSLLWLLVP